MFQRRITEFRKDAAGFGGEVAELRNLKQVNGKEVIFEKLKSNS
jgi:hypothetical protein